MNVAVYSLRGGILSEKPYNSSSPVIILDEPKGEYTLYAYALTVRPVEGAYT